MKKFALVIAAAAALFAVAPASAQDGMHRDGMQRHGGMHSMNRMMHREHRMMHREHRMMRHERRMRRHGM